jgi:hypothetical protein
MKFNNMQQSSGKEQSQLKRNIGFCSNYEEKSIWNFLKLMRQTKEQKDFS